MSDIKLKNAMENFKKALDRLGSFLSDKSVEEEYIVDIAVKRFEFSYEMTWKTLKRFLEYSGVEVKSPRDVFKEAYAMKWIDDGELFIEMIKDRNISSHEYSESKSMQIYKKVKKYYPKMREVYEFLKKKFRDIL